MSEITAMPTEHVRQPTSTAQYVDGDGTQIFDWLQTNSGVNYSPERELALAVFRQALEDYCNPTSIKSTRWEVERREVVWRFKDAEEWFTEKPHDFFSFEFICSVLFPAYDCDKIRQHVIRHRASIGQTIRHKKRYVNYKKQIGSAV